jgi:hypothetical protein
MSRCARMAGIDRDMAAYYAEGDEAERLQTWGRLERERTLLLLERVLPAPPAAVLDIGGARASMPLPWLRAATRSR